jgi:hypothetical protein
MLGMSTASVSIFFISLLFVEVARLFYMKFNKQEALILFYASWWGGMGLPVFFSQIVYRAYFINSPFAWSYKIDNSLIAKMIPQWLIPSYDSPALRVRTLFQPAYLIPLSLWSLVSALTLVIELSLAVITARIYVEEERLPFPFASVDVAMATFLSERPRGVLGSLFPSILMGVIWGIIAYVPYSIGTQIIPIPFYDLTWALENLLPGGVFAIPTTLSSYIIGFIVPLDASVYMTISSFFLWIVINSLFTTTYTEIFPEWSREYSKGMGLIAIQNRAQVRVWFAPQVGFSIAIALFLILKGKRAINLVIKGLIKMRQSENILGLPSVRSMMLLFILSSLFSAFLVMYLVPELPLWLPLAYSFGISLFAALITTAVAGEIGLTLSLPGSIWQTLVLLTPYQGYAGFVFSPAIAGGGPQLFCRQITAAISTGTKPSDLLKLWIMGSIFAMVVGLISTDIFWRMAPIPSSAYPMTVYSFLQSAYLESTIVTRQIKITVEHVLIPMVALFSILTIGDWLSRTFNLFFSSIGVATGLFSLPHGALATLIGSLLGKFLMPRLFKGKEKWDAIKSYVVLGEFLGEGMIVVLVMGIAMISKSSWLWPW